MCVSGGGTKKQTESSYWRSFKKNLCLNLRLCSVFQIKFVSACWPLVCTKIHSCFFSPRPLLDWLLSSCKVARVMCLTGAVCRCGAGSFHSLLGATECVFPSFMENSNPLRGKTWTKSGRGQVNLEISNKRKAECESAQGGREEAPVCGWRSLRLLWRREEGSIEQLTGSRWSSEKRGAPSPDYENSIEFPYAYFYWDKLWDEVIYIRLIII